MRMHNKLKKAGSKKRPKAPEKGASIARYALERERQLHELRADQLEAQNRELRETHRLLELSRDRYADLYDFAPVGYVTLDNKGLIQEINLTAARMLGIERSRLIGLPFSLYVVKRDQSAFHKHLRSLTRPDARAATELGLTVKGGGTIQVELQSVPVSEVQLAGRRIFTGILRDITEHKRDEAALRQSEARYRSLLQAVPDLMFRLKADGTYVDFHAEDPRLLAMPPEKVIGMNIRQTTLPRDVIHQCLAAIERVLATGVMETIEYSLPLPVGMREFETRIVKCGADEVVAIVRDVTQRKQAEDALRRSESNLANAQKVAHVGSYEIDVPGGERLHWSAETFRIMGLDPAQQELSLKEYFARVVHPDDQARVHEALQRTRNEAARYDVEYRLVRPDHSIRHVHSVAEPVVGPNKKVVKIIGAVQDITERKRAEEALIESERRFRHLVETTRIIAWEADVATWRFTYVGAWAEEVLGYPLADWFKDGFWADHIHPEDREAAMRTCAEGTSRDDDFELEYRMVRADGQTVWFHDIVHVARGAKGPETIKGFLIDITGRKLIADAIRESEALKRDVLNSLPANIAVLNTDGTIIAINESWRRFALENGDELVARTGLGMNYFDVCRNATSEAGEANKALAGIQAVLDGSQESFPIEYACHSPTTERWFLMSVTPLSRSRGGAVVSHLDITARKQAEVARSRLAAIVESSADAIIGRTLDGTITDWNKGAEVMFGYSADEMLGKSISVLSPPERLDELRQSLQQIQRGEVVHSFETTRIRKDRSTIDVAIAVSPIKDASGNVTGASAIVRDITERKRLEKEVLEISEREQSRIAQDLHDGLCQHLAGIEFRLLGLRQNLEATSKKQAVETAELAKLLRQAIDQTRTLSHGLSPVMLRPDGLMTALQDLVLNAEQSFGIACSFNCPTPVLIQENAVATHLYRIAQEAVQNAIRHGKAKFIVINLITHNDRIVLGVKDDGIGFPATPHPHKGMGLRVMQYRAHMVGGSLTVQHEPGGGTSVICSLRVTRTQEQADLQNRPDDEVGTD